MLYLQVLWKSMFRHHWAVGDKRLYLSFSFLVKDGDNFLLFRPCEGACMMTLQARAEVCDWEADSLACGGGMDRRAAGKADGGHVAAPLWCQLWSLGCSWGWQFGRPGQGSKDCVTWWCRAGLGKWQQQWERGESRWHLGSWRAVALKWVGREALVLFWRHWALGTDAGEGQSEHSGGLCSVESVPKLSFSICCV